MLLIFGQLNGEHFGEVFISPNVNPRRLSVHLRFTQPAAKIEPLHPMIERFILYFVLLHAEHE